MNDTEDTDLDGRRRWACPGRVAVEPQQRDGRQHRVAAHGRVDVAAAAAAAAATAATAATAAATTATATATATATTAAAAAAAATTTTTTTAATGTPAATGQSPVSNANLKK